MDQPAWLAAAWAEFGVREKPGAANADAVLGYFAEAGHRQIRDDATPWCAAFAGAMLKRAGLDASGSLMARSYLKWGSAIDAPRLAAITVLTRGKSASAGHVGFYLGHAANRVFLLGGNRDPDIAGRLGRYRRWRNRSADTRRSAGGEYARRHCPLRRPQTQTLPGAAALLAVRPRLAEACRCNRRAGVARSRSTIRQNSNQERHVPNE